jgi:quinol monooxygenase YgiN
MIHLNGHLIAASEAEADLIRRHLPAHIALTRAEPGCISFEVTQGSDPLIWDVAECFTDQAAFDAHQARTRESDWFAATQGIRRAYRITRG